MKAVRGHRYLVRREDQLYFRRRVPLDAVAAFGGRREVLKSLGTTSLADARHKLAIEVARFDKAVSEAIGKPVADAVRQIVSGPLPDRIELEEAVRHWLAARDERATGSDVAIANPQEAEQMLQELTAHSADVRRGISLGAGEPAVTTIWLAEDICEENGWIIDRGSSLWRYLLQLVGRGQLDANGWFAADLNGDARSVQDVRFSAEHYRQDELRQKERASSAPVEINSLLTGYLKEHQPKPATERVWRRHLAHFTAFLGHEDATRVTLADVVRWKEMLLETPPDGGKPRSARTVRESYLAAVRSVFKWAAANGKIASNPVAGVTVGGKRKPPERDKGLTDEEAQIILSATLKPPPEGLSPERQFARRWVPWICAYTGARVNEITQARAQDICKVNNIWTIYITPEAGGVKDGKARTVALHPHLLEQGFLRAIAGKEGPLFYNPALQRGGSKGHPQFKKVGEYLARWVREEGVTDPNVWPNHGWRHRFKTQARMVGIDPEVRDFIQGHVPRTEGEAYGGTPAEVSWKAIKRMPRYKIPGV
jgi:integrase